MILSISPLYSIRSPRLSITANQMCYNFYFHSISSPCFLIYQSKYSFPSHRSSPIAPIEINMEDTVLWAIITAIMVAILIFLFYMGVFSSLPVETLEEESMIIAYRNYQGPYRNIDHFYHVLLDNAREKLGTEYVPKMSIYIYHDDPRGTPNQKLLRWSVGFILNSEDEREALEEIEDINIDELPSGRVFSRHSCTFPYRNLISLGLGGRKAFDAFYSAAKHKELEIYCPPMELRTSNNGSIQYIQYIDNNDNINALFSNEFIKCN